MDENQTQQNSNSVDSTINAVANLTKEIPVYRDAVQPLAKETGKALETVGKAVNVCLAPIRGLVWGAEKIEEFVNTKVTDKLKDIPEEDIITPDPHIAGPLIESLRFTGNNEELKEMYANLLASSMNKNESNSAHPSFVDIIKNMTSDEAKIIRFLYKYERKYPMIHIYVKEKIGKGEQIISPYVSELFDQIDAEFNMASYYDNLLRLKLVEIPKGVYLTNDQSYNGILKDKDVVSLIEEINSVENKTERIDKTYISLTSYGKQFAKVSVSI